MTTEKHIRHDINNLITANC